MLTKFYTRKYYIYITLLIAIFIVITFLYYNEHVSLKSQTLFIEYNFFSEKKVSNEYKCSIYGQKWIIVTTIFYPTKAINKFLNLKTEWHLIVIGDRKTPKDWLSHVEGNRSRLIYLSLDEQVLLNYSIIKHLPIGSYARKNLGYLIAIQCGAKLIFESDDDNYLEQNDIYYLPKRVNSIQVPWISFHRQRSSSVNIYGSFGHPNIWPRGFPIDELKLVAEDGWHSVQRNFQNHTNVYIQQYLADLDPDVDALYRLTHPLTIGKIKFDRKQLPIALEPFTFSPYNTQNTITHYEAFWGLYLPITTTFRVCDIWRSFWVQRLLWDIDGQIMFGKSTIKQIRNVHSLIDDMDDEHQLYHQTSSFIRFLSSWSSALPTLPQRISQLIKDIVNAQFMKSNEIEFIRAWISDLQSIGYQFPAIVPLYTSPFSSTVRHKRAALCVTGFTECFREAFIKNYAIIRKSLKGEIDTFLFLSSSISNGPIPLHIRLEQIRSYKDSAMTILYEDRKIDPNIPKDCETNFILPKHIYKIDAYYQQLWALDQCYNLVRDYEKHFNIKYQLMIRSRVDILAKHQFTLERDGLYNVNNTILVPPNRFFKGIDDGFAVGPMELMHHYMTRWNSLKICPPDKIYHSETYLKRHLENFTNITIDRTLPAAADALPHKFNSCH